MIRRRTPSRRPHSSGRADRLVVRIIDDLLDCIELWHSAGCDDARWVVDNWHRTMAPRFGVELPVPVRVATEASEMHQALLAWQDAVTRR